ncbi:MAG TPA: AAA family ATPase [Planctomycetota bacterium]|nr:AAA family ATPase [Planctomycetota bacterium]
MEPEQIISQSQDGTYVAMWVDDLSQVAPRGVGWLWPGRVPLGKVTLLVGDPGRGKSLLALDMAARISRGVPWPDASGGSAPLGRTVLLSAEDDTADTIRPRLDALGGDPSRVRVVRAVDWEDGHGAEAFSLSRDLVALEAVIRQWSDTRLVILDPVSAYLGGAESYNNADIRRALAPVQDLAERTGVAVVAITHLTKRAGASVIYRAMGSLAFVSAARAVWAAVPDRDVPGRMLLVPVKCNLAGGVTGMAYRIVPHPDDPALPTVVWEPEPVAITADEAMAALPKPTPREEAAEWLKQVLSMGPLPSAEVERQAREAGFALMTLRRAKWALGVIPYREGAGWMCRLPYTPGDAPAVPVELRAEPA